MMLAPARRASCQCFFVTSAPPAKKTKSILSKEACSIAWINAGSSPADVICPATSSSSSRMKFDAASSDSPNSSLTSLPASDDAPTTPTRYTLFVIDLLQRFYRSFAGFNLRRVVPPFPAPRVRQPRYNAGHKISQGNRDQHVFGIQRYQRTNESQHRNELKRMSATEADLLTAPETPAAHHQKPCEEDEAQPYESHPRVRNRRAVFKMNDRCKDSCTCWNRHADKVFPARAPRVPRLRINADVEPRKP